MDKQEILRQLKNGVAMRRDGTFTTDEDFYGYMLRLISESNEEEYHKEQVERLLYHTQELLQYQRKFHNTSKVLTNERKRLLGECKSKEEFLFKKVHHLTTNGKYTIERFKKEIPKPNTMFD